MDAAGLPERLQARLARGRAAARARMTSLVTVRRTTGRATQNEATGREDAAWTDVHTNLPFRLDRSGAAQSGGARARNIADTTVQNTVALGRVPYDTADLANDDLIRVTAGEWAGTVWRVVDASEGDQQTDRRFEIEQTKAPSEWED